MKRNSIILKVVILLIGIGSLALLLWEPHIEGRNAHSKLFEIYFNDPFLAYAYIASIPYFIALYQAFIVVDSYGNNKLISQTTLRAIRIIKFCAISIICFVMAGEVFIILQNSDDRAGGVFIGILLIMCSAAIAVSAAKFERILQKRN